MLDIDPVLLLIVAIAFLLVLARLNSCLYKPLLKHMDDRDKSLKKDLEDAKNNATDVDGMLVEANNIIAKAKKEAASIRQDAYSDAEAVATSKLENAKKEVEKKYSEFSTTLNSETTDLKQKLMQQMPLFKQSVKAKLNSI